MTLRQIVSKHLRENGWQCVGVQEYWLWYTVDQNETRTYITLHEDGVKLSQNTASPGKPQTKRATQVLYSDPRVFNIIEEFIK